MVKKNSEIAIPDRFFFGKLSHWMTLFDHVQFFQFDVLDFLFTKILRRKAVETKGSVKNIPLTNDEWRFRLSF